MAKSKLNIAWGGALPALFSPRARYRWLQNLRVLAWYARGRPLDWGLSHATKAKQGVAA